MAHALLAPPLIQGTSGTEELWTPRMLVPVYGGSDPQQKTDLNGLWAQAPLLSGFWKIRLVGTTSLEREETEVHVHSWGVRVSWLLAPAKKGGEKKGRSAISEVVTREHPVTVHKRTRGVGFKKRAPRALREIRKFAMKEMGTPDVRIDTRLNKAVWAKGIRNVPYRIHVWLPRKRNEDEDSSNKLYTLVTYVPVTTFKNLQTVNVDEKKLLIIQ
ncbi:PREDICTED: 60S ribosomal protein L31-like [Lipotes vexillifer]|uniref:Large ribosomal subunit protein eL31 n=1 Tax=Lipotes vexillifer TaxID=118797 RepID=A0A340WJI6_LIPVE|nr:PREDICTED: 60S ribosomal protein L31-like [Lipotes vexillifer]